MRTFVGMPNDNANPGTETEQPGIYPGKTGPELPGRPKAEPEVPVRRGVPEREMPNYPHSPEPEVPRMPPPSTPEAPPPHAPPQQDQPPVMT